MTIPTTAAPRGKSFGSGFNPSRYRPTKRTSYTEQEYRAARAPHRACGGTFQEMDSQYTVYLACDGCGAVIDPNKVVVTDMDIDGIIVAAWQDDDAATVPSAPQKAAKVTSGSSDAEQLLELLGRLGGAGKTVDTAEVERIAVRVLAEGIETILQALKDSGALRQVIEIRKQDAPAVTLKDAAHKSFPAVLARASYVRSNGGRFNIMLVGPKGCGKTHLAHQIAEAMALPYGALSCGAGTTDGEIIGRVIPDITGGVARLQESLFLRFYGNGGVFLLDEIDALNPTTGLRLNMALENGRMFDALGNEVIRHPNFVCIAGANTWGNGASREYCGREMQDAALLDRFTGGMFDFDYCRTLEAKLCPDANLAKRLWAMRDAAIEKKMQRRIIGTRAMIAAFELVAGMGMTHDAALLEVTSGWSAADRSAVGVTA